MIALMRRDFYTIPLLVYILFFVGLFVGYLLFSLPITMMAIVLFATFCFSPYLYDGQKQTIKTFASLPVGRELLVRSRYVYAGMWVIGLTAVIIGVMLLASFFESDVYVMPWRVVLFYAGMMIIFIAISLPHWFLYQFQVASFVVLLQMIILFNVFFSFTFNQLFEDAKIDTADGFIVEMTSQSLDRSFEVIAGGWSATASLLFFAGAIGFFALSYAIVAKIYKRKKLA